MEFLLLITIATLSALGLSLTFLTTRRGQSDVGRSLFRRLTCISFVKSPHFYFLGIPLNILAGVYYVLLLSLIFGGWFLSDMAWAAFAFLVLFGALFSVYYILIHLIVDRNICASVLTAIFIPVVILGIFFLNFPFEALVDQVRALAGVMTITAKTVASAGLVLATVSFLSFLLFMDDMRISSGEAKKLTLISEGNIFFAITLFVLGIGIMLANDMVTYIQTLSLALGITSVTAVCEFTKTARIRPALVFMSLKKNRGKGEERELLKRLAFGVEGIAITSWLFVVFLYIFPTGEMPVSQTLGLYVLLVIVVFLLSQLVRANQHNGKE